MDGKSSSTLRTSVPDFVRTSHYIPPMRMCDCSVCRLRDISLRFSFLHEVLQGVGDVFLHLLDSAIDLKLLLLEAVELFNQFFHWSSPGSRVFAGSRAGGYRRALILCPANTSM